MTNESPKSEREPGLVQRMVGWAKEGVGELVRDQETGKEAGTG